MSRAPHRFDAEGGRFTSRLEYRGHVHQTTIYELTPQQVNRLDDDSFVDAFGEIYERPPWIAERARPSRPFSSVGELQSAMKRTVEDASREKQPQLFRARPDLGERTEMTDASEAEQASAELGSLSRSQYETFQRLSGAHREWFDFPFVMAVRDENPDAIAATMECRVDHSESAEFRVVLDEVHAIAELRLAERFSSE